LAFAAWRSKLRDAWRQVQVRNVQISERQIKVGTELVINAIVDLGQLTPNDVRVQLYYGELDSRGDIDHGGEAVDMTPDGSNGPGAYKFTTKVTYSTSGERGVSVRVVPFHQHLTTNFLPGFITWARE
jgi:starch phosphorylase